MKKIVAALVLIILSVNLFILIPWQVPLYRGEYVHILQSPGKTEIVLYPNKGKPGTDLHATPWSSRNLEAILDQLLREGDALAYYGVTEQVTRQITRLDKLKVPSFSCGEIELVSAAVLEQGDIPRTTFLTYGGKTMTAVHWDKDEAILVDCHDSYDAASLAENARSPFRWGILTTDDTENMLTTYQNGGMEAVIAPKELFTPEQREELLIEAEEKRLRLIFLSDGQRLSLGRVKVEFFPVMDERRALRLRFGEKTLVTLQGLEGKDIEKLCADKVKIQCDYLKIPFAVLPEGTDLSVLTDGKILDREKNTAIQ